MASVTDSRGGKRGGAGRRPIYECGTVWLTIPLPRDFAEELGSPKKLRRRVLKRLKSSRGALPWNERAIGTSDTDSP